MSRFVQEIEVGGKKLKALFDTGSLRSYIRREFLPSPARKVSPIFVGLGGKTVQLDDRCDLTAKIDGLEFDFTAYAINEIGEVEQGRVDVLVGATAMEEWWIKVDPKGESLDLSKLRNREFVEF